MFGIGWEWILVIVLIVLLFGAKRIPEVAKGLGEGIRSFKSGLHGEERKSIEAQKAKESQDSEQKVS